MSFIRQNMRIISRAHLSARAVIPRVLPTRSFASSLPDLPASLMNSPLFTKLRHSPAILAQILKITNLFEQRGIKMGSAPTYDTMRTIQRDEEILAELGNLKKVMDEEGVTLDVQEMLKAMK